MEPPVRPFSGLLIFLVMVFPSSGSALDAKTKNVLAQLRKGELVCYLDALFAVPKVWKMTSDDLDRVFRLPDEVPSAKNPFFSWLTEDRERAHFSQSRFSDVRVKLFLEGGLIPVQEVVVDFSAGKVSGLSFSVFNRGDSSELSKSEFEQLLEKCIKMVSREVGTRPFVRKPNSSQGLLTKGWVWSSEESLAAVEINPEAESGNPEYLRLRLFSRNSTSAIAATLRSRHSAIKLSDLRRHVQKDAGRVVIQGVPMVDQGPKGYCVVASCQRVFEHYGIPSDQHQLAQVAKADRRTGTDPIEMEKALSKIDYRFKTRFKKLMQGEAGGDKWDVTTKNHKVADASRFLVLIRRSVDKGVPLLWGMKLVESDEEEASITKGTGHMRLIIGYDENSRTVIFSDSWGAGHEKKEMNLEEAFRLSTCLFALQPSTR